MRKVETPRLVLEPQTAAHAESMFEVLQDPALYEHENEPPPSVDWLRERYRKLESRSSASGDERWLNWVVRLRPSQSIGFVQATVRDDGSAAIAYVLASEHWGRGLAQEAVAAMIGELAGQYGVASIDAVLKRSNARSRRLLERLGFALASSAAHAAANVPADEMLMQGRAGGVPP
jgi:RimJ/RimL family protein N-acetyltransferase